MIDTLAVECSLGPERKGSRRAWAMYLGSLKEVQRIEYKWAGSNEETNSLD